MSTPGKLAGAVQAWLRALSADQRASATYAFDDAERLVWAFTPGERKGLALRDMDTVQRRSAMAIVHAALSRRGSREVAGVIALETILGEIEHSVDRSGWQRRDPELYWFAVFGDPAGSDPWMWRVGGHHVAISTTVLDGEVLATSPSFLGANPAVVPEGWPRARARTLTGEERLARHLLAALSPDQVAVAVVDRVAPPEILTSNSPRADARSVPSGLRHADMDAAGRAGLEALIRHYLGRAADDIAAGDWQRAVADGLSETTFAWAGPTEPRRGHYYAIRGPRLVIEYDNTQNGANHIHAVWRDLANDWGEDLLAAHYRNSHAPMG